MVGPMFGAKPERGASCAMAARNAPLPTAKRKSIECRGLIGKNPSAFLANLLRSGQVALGLLRSFKSNLINVHLRTSQREGRMTGSGREQRVRFRADGQLLVLALRRRAEVTIINLK